ncbi:MAG: EAL domain-containing protein [Coriobacteriia bacterium]|nr:EAL domain-containing protein [Coriobacteriia bacterium]
MQTLAEYSVIHWTTLGVYAIAFLAVTFALAKPGVAVRWRLAAAAFSVACIAGVVVTLGGGMGVVALSSEAAALLGAVQAVGLAWGALAFRAEIQDAVTTGELLTGMEAVRSAYADGAGAVVATLDTDGTVRHMNRFGLDLLGRREDEVVGRNAFTIWGVDVADSQAKKEFESFCDSGGQLGSCVEYPVEVPVGRRIIRWTRSAVLNEAGDVTQVISYGEDVTEQRRVEDTLRCESYLLDSVHDSVIVTRLDGEILYLNHAAHAMRGYTREEFLELQPFSWIAEESVEHAMENQRLAVESGTTLYEVMNLRKDGRLLPVETRSQLVEFEGGPAIMNVSRDVSARQQAEELMSQMAFDDPLTGLPNRRLVSQRLKLALAELGEGSSEGVAVIYIDVDNLKAVNDTVGHDGGDQLIKIMADRLSWVTRNGDTLGRVGGDEFVLIIPDLAATEHAEDIAHRLLAFAAETLDITGLLVRPSASIGIYYCEPGMSPSESLKRADRAMYVAKKAGGNRFAIYDPSMDMAISERFRMRNELADAVERGELEVYYQPMAVTGTLEVTGVEALVRWRHPTRGFMSPEHFMTIAEESSLIVPIGRWILFEACSTLARWRAAGVPVPRVSVNVSAAQLIDGDLVHDVSEVLVHTGLQPRDLELEITETAVMRSLDVVTPVFERLRTMGVSLALDDFGTGHSSLERLQGLPISTLKIDRSFITDLCVENGSHPIIDTILVLASKLKLRTVAEGVESTCHLEYLERSGCDEVQGFLFSKPCSAEETGRLLRAGGMHVQAGSRITCERRSTCARHCQTVVERETVPCPAAGPDFDRVLDLLACEIERCGEPEG